MTLLLTTAGGCSTADRSEHPRFQSRFDDLEEAVHIRCTISDVRVQSDASFDRQMKRAEGEKMQGKQDDDHPGFGKAHTSYIGTSKYGLEVCEVESGLLW